MKVTIRGARGSIPTPLRPAEVREKIISAILNLSKIQDEAFREELIAAILESDRSTAIFEQERRELVETYLDHLSPLASVTAGGNTACIEVRSASDDVFILDAGSGIRQLGLELMQGPCGRGQGVVHLFFSHPHWDHIQGFPFFRPAFVPGNKIYLYGVHDIEVVLRRQQEFITFPVSLDYMQADLHFVRLEPGETLDFGDLRVRSKPNHHPGDSFAYRFEEGGKAFVYATDASYPAGIDLRPHLDFFDDANLLIFDSQFTQRESDEKEDWGHSSSFVGIEMAQAAHVENLLIYHYDPTYTDAEIEKILADAIKFQQNQYSGQKPVNILLAKEGQTFDLTPAQGVQLQQVPGGNVAILKPAGIFDELVVAALKVQLEALKQSGWPCQLIIDMSEVDLLQVAGLRALVKLHKEMTGGAHLALAGPSINVQQLIELAGYLDFFAIYPSTHAALNVLRARETLNLPGQILKNRYTIQSKIGEGFLGVVFKATDTRLDRPVAVKVLSASFSEEAIEQFLEQGRQIVALNHPNIVNVYDCDDEHGLSFMVEELVEGKLLDTLLAENSGRPVSLDIALDIAHDITLGLEYAHTHGVIHGDLKPKNVLLADRVKISDFGLGHLDSGKSLLNLDAPLVNVHYLAPEQVLGHPIDGRTDLYALGVILYELFTGRRPFEGTDQEVLEHHRRSVPRPPRELNPGLSPSLDHLVLKLLDKDPNRRYASAYRVRCILESIVPPTARHAWPALVGRDKPLQRLLDLWAETQQGRGQLVFVSGKAGSGKTRLARALVQAAGEAVVLSAVCPPPPTPAYQIFMEAITTRLAASPEPDPVRLVLQELAACVPEMAARLSLYPDLCKCEPPVSGPAPVSLAQTLAKATPAQPWLLILDDLHQADPSSLHLLRYLAGHCEQMKLMIVGLYTPAEAGQPNPLADLLTDLKRDAAPYTTLALEPLPQAKTKELLENLWAQAVPLDLAAAIHRRTQGNPLYAGEVARGLVDEGIVTRRESKWRLTAVVEGELPQNLAETVARRANRLNRVTQSLLYQAVTLGQTFYFEDLREMSDLAPGEVLENLDILLERQLLEEEPIVGVLRFKHPAIHQALADHLGQSKRRLLHREAADSLELRYAANTAPLAAVLAHHFNQAEAFDKVIPYSLQAAQQAEALFAAPTALVWYDLALAALDHQPAGEETNRQRFDLLLAHERLYHRLGQRRAQAADLTALHTLAAADPPRQAAAHSRQAEYERALGRLTAAADAAQAGLEAARQAKSQALEAENLVQLGRIAALQGDFTAVHDHLYAARQLFVTLSDQPGEARCLNGLAGISMHLNDYAEAEADYQQALTMNRAAGDRPGQTVTLNNLGRLYVQTGNYTDAFTALNQALTLNRLIGCRQGEATSLHYLALTYQAMGHYDTVRTYLEQALSIRRAIEDCQGEAEDLRALGLTQLALGDCQAARDYIGQALEIFQSTKIYAYEGDTWLMLGLALEGLNDMVKARHAYEQAHLSHEKTGNEAGFIEAHAGLARCLLIAGQLDEAKTEIEVCLTWLKPHGALGINYPLRLYLAAYGILQAAGSPAAADEALQAGQALLRKLADGIEDDELRRSFLEKVEENRELVRL